jgi:hypothetical protein
MTSWTVHIRNGRPVVLLPERFSIAAALFGPAWLLWHAAWIPAVLLACAWVVAVVVTPTALLPAVAFGLVWFAGLTGRDLRRWAMARRGWREAHVVVASGEDAALERVLRADPSLAAAELGRSAP